MNLLNGEKMNKVLILSGDKGNIDFANPIVMTLKQKKYFFNLLNSMFAVVQPVDNLVLRSWRMGENGRIQYPHNWTAEEYEFIIKCNSLEEAVDKLARSGMSVLITMGVWMPKYYNWMNKNKKDMSKINEISLIKEFMKEHEEELLNRRNARKIVRKEVKKLQNIIDSFEQREEETKTLIMLGKAIDKDLEHLKKEKIDAQTKLKKIIEKRG